MKPTRRFLLSAIVLALVACLVTVFPQRFSNSITKTVTTNTVPEQLTTTIYWGHTVTFLGMKAARTNNTGTVYIQWNSTNQGAGIPLQPGGTLSISTSDQRLPMCSTNFWIDVDTDGDGVVAFIMD